MASTTYYTVGAGSNVSAYRPHGQVWISSTSSNLPIRHFRNSQEFPHFPAQRAPVAVYPQDHRNKGKGKGHPRTGHEGPEVE